MLRRSLLIALVVGTILTAINQGDLLLYGRWNVALAWKVPLTYAVPFLVATWSALINGRTRPSAFHP
ncbi:MAG: nitrate/nitrite transporter NrtS [candidate division NC10 bacterium]